MQSNEEAEDQELSHSPGHSEPPTIPSNKILEIRELQKEQQRLLKIIVQLYQKIRIPKARQRVRSISARKNATTPAKPLKKKRQRTKVHPAIQNLVENQVTIPNDAEEQTDVPIKKRYQWVDIHVKIEMDEMLTRDKEIQMETPPSGVIRVMS